MKGGKASGKDDAEATVLRIQKYLHINVPSYDLVLQGRTVQPTNPSQYYTIIIPQGECSLAGGARVSRMHSRNTSY